MGKIGSCLGTLLKTGIGLAVIVLVIKCVMENPSTKRPAGAVNGGSSPEEPHHERPREHPIRR